MPPALHKIKQQRIEISLTDGANSFQMQTQLGQVCRQQLAPKLDELFCALSPAGQTHQIERLEVDLGVLSTDNLATTLVVRTLTELAKILPKQLNQSNQDITDIDTEPDNLSTQMADSQQHLRTLTIIGHYLQYACLPWWADKVDIKALINRQLEQDSQLFGNTVLDCINDNAEAATRLFNLLTGSQWRLLATPQAAQNQTLSAALAKVYQHIKAARFAQGATDLVLIGSTVLQNDLTRLIVDHNNQQLSALCEVLYNGQKPAMATTTGQTPPHSDSPSATERVSFWLGKFTPGLLLRLHKSKKPPATVPHLMANPVLDEYFVSNSGLILLWPFLQSFCTVTGFYQPLEAPKRLSSPGMMVKALHYLAFGTAPVCEQPMVLSKLLCGLMPDAAIELATDPDNSELTVHQGEADKLLLAVVQHIRQNTKVTEQAGEWLRQLFLQREGILRQRDGLWRLQVEAKPVDVLLKKLPWAISSVKLPWTDNVLMVEWSI